jgi:hypothetical protein
MPAPPARADLFPAGALAPATAKTKWAAFFDYVLALLGSAGTAADLLACLGSGAAFAPITTGGSSTAYTLTPSTASTANAAGQRYRIKFHAAAGATPTLAVSGQAALNLKYKDSTGAKRAITSVQVPINWISDVESDGTDWMVLQPVLAESGTWTPAFSSSGATFTPTVSVGSYTKVGNQVTIQGALAASASGTVTNPISITGLPFPMKTLVNGAQSCSVGYSQRATGVVSGYANSATSAIILIMAPSTSATPTTLGINGATGETDFAMTYTTD